MPRLHLRVFHITSLSFLNVLLVFLRNARIQQYDQPSNAYSQLKFLSIAKACSGLLRRVYRQCCQGQIVRVLPCLFSNPDMEGLSVGLKMWKSAIGCSSLVRHWQHTRPLGVLVIFPYSPPGGN